MRNVAGELLGALLATSIACKSGFSSVKLRYDYEGVEKWVTGEWKATNIYTKQYVNQMREKQSLISINFMKIRAHSGDYYNEIADNLAKEALDLANGI